MSTISKVTPHEACSNFNHLILEGFFPIFFPSNSKIHFFLFSSYADFRTYLPLFQALPSNALLALLETCPHPTLTLEFNSELEMFTAFAGIMAITSSTKK